MMSGCGISRLRRHVMAQAAIRSEGNYAQTPAARRYDFNWDAKAKDWRREYDDDHSAGRRGSMSSVGEILELPKKARAGRKEWQKRYC